MTKSLEQIYVELFQSITEVSEDYDKFRCLFALVTCTRRLKKELKVQRNCYIFKIIFVVTFQIFHNFITNIHISLQFFCFIYLDYLYFKKVQTILNYIVLVMMGKTMAE